MILEGIHTNIIMFFSNFSTCCLLVLIGCLSATTIKADQCQAQKYVYGENSIFDELLVCSLSRNFDLDLTPQGDHVKSTAKTLIEQGLSDKTTIVHAKLSGFWTARRPGFVETGWRCEPNKINVNSLVEMSNLVLEVIERIDVPHHRNQQKLAHHRPCKTLDVPLWLCRQSNPIYRTVTTWVNKAYFNVTLGQQATGTKPTIERLSMMFTCPETFKQKITHSPSAAYLLEKHIPSLSSPPSGSKVVILNNKKHSKRSVGPGQVDDSLAHPTHSHIQTGRSPASPPYHNSVNLITTKVTEVLRKSIGDCIDLIDSDLTLMKDHSSFKTDKYLNLHEDVDLENNHQGTSSECSNKLWLKNRIELSSQAEALASTASSPMGNNQQAAGASGGLTKRDQQQLSSAYPNDPNQLLDPYTSYHQQEADKMINYS